MSDTIYYVYAWLKNSGEPYYIGKGKNNRAWRKGHGIVQIIATNLTEKEALNFESILIRKIGRKDLNEGPLHNTNDGMIGGDVSSHPNYIKGIKKYHNNKAKEEYATYGFLGKSHKPGFMVGENNSMYGKGDLLKGKTKNKRLTCPICNLESNSSNIKRHIKIKHNQEWKDVLTNTINNV